MAVQPSDATLATWLGTGAGIGVVTTTAGSHYVIPKAGVQAYIGNDAVITDDIRDFLFSVLSKLADTYSGELTTGNTRPTKVVITKALSTVNNTAAFSVRIDTSSIVLPADYATVPVYA